MIDRILHNLRHLPHRVRQVEVATTGVVAPADDIIAMCEAAPSLDLRVTRDGADVVAEREFGSLVMPCLQAVGTYLRAAQMLDAIDAIDAGEASITMCRADVPADSSVVSLAIGPDVVMVQRKYLLDAMPRAARAVCTLRAVEGMSALSLLASHTAARGDVRVECLIMGVRA